MEYKNTLNLPKTDFPMKADLPNREPKIIKAWEDNRLHEKLRNKKKGSPKFILHDGPPYANGSIHMGHALNKLLKDFVIRYKTMRGFDSPYIPGWDCHGLPVEHQLFKELKITKYDIDQVEFRKKAHDYAMRYVAIQREEFKRLGIMGHWDKPYVTIDKDYEAEIVRSFASLVEKGYIYKDLKPVNWCGVCETALAEAEVEYEDKVSPSIYVKFESMHNDLPGHFLIWTTTPWTLVANVAIAVHPDFDYVFVEIGDGAFKGEKFILAKDLLGRVMQDIGVNEYKILKTMKGVDLEGLEARHPFIDRASQVVLAPYVTIEDGTGCVHTAPGHGQDDYITGKRYNLPTIMPVDMRGKFDHSAGEYSGMKITDANKLIIERLALLGKLVKHADIKHSYPHCWRCKKPIIFRATDQYFLKIDHDGLRNRMLEAISKDIKWVPPAGESRISAMVKNRPDWCLSRQRYWGVPIVAFYCKDCGAVLLDSKVIEYVASLVREHGADVWFSRAEKDLLPADTKCKKCNSVNFRKETDIIDVWFDSGVSHQAVLKNNKDMAYPAQLYLEGSDQHRGWFQSALITGMAMDIKPPYKSVLTHGFVVDGEGKKMSKSMGNVITPEQVMKKYGADILRLWVASSDYSIDIRLSDEILTRLADAYRKIRNTYKYLLSNLFDFDPLKNSVRYEDMLEIDRWILSKLSEVVKSAQTHYETYAFHRVYRDVYGFCVNEISSVYLDILKDRMYTFRADSIQRRSGQTAMFEIFTSITKILAPILSMTSDEAWGYITVKGKEESVHLESWPEDNFSVRHDPALNLIWSKIISLRESVLKKLEEKRALGDIGSGLEAKVRLFIRDEDFKKILTERRDDLKYIFIVSQVEFKDSPVNDSDVDPVTGAAIYIEKASGEKCQRCWNYSDSVGRESAHPTLCDRCVKAI